MCCFLHAPLRFYYFIRCLFAMMYTWAVLFCAGFASSAMLPRDALPQVIAHRGASGYLPEHSLNAYQLAIDLGADYIEPDLCLSKDGIFVVVHDVTLDDVTDVASHPEFSDRYTTKTVDGVPTSGYFISDFLLDELKTLRLRQRLNSRTTMYDGLFQIPTLSEVLDLAWTHYNATNYTVGVYMELKHPDYHNELGFPSTMEEMLLDQLTLNGYEIHNVSNDLSLVQPIVIQCFQPPSLRTLHSMTDIPLLQLTQLFDKKTFADIATYAQGVGPEKGYFAKAPLSEALEGLEEAHNLGLRVHPWTMRQEEKYVDDVFNNDPQIEAAYFYCCLKIDGTFSEFPDQMRQVMDELVLDSTALCARAGC